MLQPGNGVLWPPFNSQGDLGRWIFQRGVDNGSEGHCLGTVEKKRFVTGRAPLQVAPQLWQEKLTGHIFLQVDIVTEPKLRAQPNDRVR